MDRIEALVRCRGNDGELPLPLAGEGWGGGASASTGANGENSPTRRACARRPPPQAGGVIKPYDARNGPKFARSKAGLACILAHHSATRGCFLVLTSSGAI